MYAIEKITEERIYAFAGLYREIPGYTVMSICVFPFSIGKYDFVIIKSKIYSIDSDIFLNSKNNSVALGLFHLK